MEKAIDQGSDFAIALKGNHENLLHNSQKAFDLAIEKKSSIRSFKEEVDYCHGRIEQRSIELIDMPLEYLNGHRHIKQICKISRFREQKNKPTLASTEIAYMVTSLDQSYRPEYLLKLNRGHWACENNLNWVKDNVFFEDKSTVSIGSAPFVMSLLRSLAIALIKTVSNKITETREKLNWHKSLLWRLISP